MKHFVLFILAVHKRFKISHMKLCTVVPVQHVLYKVRAFYYALHFTKYSIPAVYDCVKETFYNVAYKNRDFLTLKQTWNM